MDAVTELALALGASVVVNLFLIWRELRRMWRRAAYKRRQGQAGQRAYQSRIGVR